MSWGNVIGAGVGLVGSIFASNSASSATRAAANASTQANEANLQLAREQRDMAIQLFSQYLGDENMAQAYLDALLYGEGSYTPGAGIPTGGSAYSAVSAENYLRQRFPQEAALWDSWERAGNSNTNGHRTLWGDFTGYLQSLNPQVLQQALADMQAEQATSNAEDAQTITRDQVLQMIEGTPLAQYANEDFLAREGLTQEYLDGAYSLADEEYGDITGQAQANLDQRLALEDDSYAAWLPMSQQAERDAIDLNFSRGGVTGLIGETRRGVGETTQDAAMERNLRYLTGRQAAYSPYYDDMMDATALRGGRRQGAYDTYSGRRAGNYDQYAGDRLNSYADFVTGLQGRVGAGRDARGTIASSGQNYVRDATSANSANARAQSEAAYNRGQITQQLYGDLSRIAGDAWGSIRNKKDKD